MLLAQYFCSSQILSKKKLKMVRASSDGHMIAALTDTGQLVLYKNQGNDWIEDCEFYDLHSSTSNAQVVDDCSFSSDDSLFIVLSDSCQISWYEHKNEIWRLVDSFTFDSLDNDSIFDCVFSGRGLLLALLTEQGKLTIRSTSVDNNYLHLLDVCSCTFSTNQTIAAVYLLDGKLSFFTSNNDVWSCDQTIQVDGLERCHFSLRNEVFVALTSDDRLSLYVYNDNAWRYLQELDNISDFLFSPNQKKLLVLTINNELVLYAKNNDSKVFTETKLIHSFDQAVIRYCFSYDGKTLTVFTKNDVHFFKKNGGFWMHMHQEHIGNIDEVVGQHYFIVKTHGDDLLTNTITVLIPSELMEPCSLKKTDNKKRFNTCSEPKNKKSRYS